MSLKDDLTEWLYSDEEAAGLLSEGHVEPFVDLLWDQLQAKLGPVQEKLLNDVTLARTERDQALARLEVALNELSRIQRSNDS